MKILYTFELAILVCISTSFGFWQRSDWWYRTPTNDHPPSRQANATTLFDSKPNFNTFCNRSEILNGRWEAVTYDRPPYVPRTTHLRCYPDEVYTSGSWKTYQWKPYAPCKFLKFSRDKFCAVMHRKTILIAGDSLSWEQFSSLAQLLGQRVHQKDQWKSKEENRNHVQLACHNNVRIVFRRDDLLQNVWSGVQESFPEVLVLNRGSHYVNDSRLLSSLDVLWKDIDMWRHQCVERNKTCHLFWRTSVPGHPGCADAGRNFTQPNNDLQEMERLVQDRSNYKNISLKYHWYDYQHQNLLILKELQQAVNSKPGIDEKSASFTFQVLDAYELNIRRPDEHRAHQNDCLHNCYPGKMDVYNQLLLHYLVLQAPKSN